LIEGRETERVEFKASLRVDMATGQVNRELLKVVAKTLAGFLNASGGTLLIGFPTTGRFWGSVRTSHPSVGPTSTGSSGPLGPRLASISDPR
jgi:hypothetical protein